MPSSNTLYLKQHFYKQHKAELDPNQANAKKYSEADLLLFGNHSPSSSTLLSRNNRTYSKK